MGYTAQQKKVISSEGDLARRVAVAELYELSRLGQALASGKAGLVRQNRYKDLEAWEILHAAQFLSAVRNKEYRKAHRLMLDHTYAMRWRYAIPIETTDFLYDLYGYVA